jgi:hypothetical protein
MDIIVERRRLRGSKKIPDEESELIGSNPVLGWETSIMPL